MGTPDWGRIEVGLKHEEVKNDAGTRSPLVLVLTGKNVGSPMSRPPFPVLTTTHAEVAPFRGLTPSGSLGALGLDPVRGPPALRRHAVVSNT